MPQLRTRYRYRKEHIVKLKEFLENVITTEVVVCIPPQIIAEKPELHNFVESLKNEYKIDTAINYHPLK